jgi:hypothetical protein
MSVSVSRDGRRANSENFLRQRYGSAQVGSPDCMLTAIVINAILAAVILSGILGLLVWGIRTAPRDLGQVANRRWGAERRRRHARRPAPAYAVHAETERRRAERRDRGALPA